ncbi:hypothetical protein GE061_011219 [Apolygus lucorum]|uniref:SCP domain-containing protein n=1 Tax=Apolygus lucorum TaxID=248454 RepID=A0A8S9XY92_APOLU|nr:hypothetical protein GE061_011219 [Apolygus lucorum]
MNKFNSTFRSLRRKKCCFQEFGFIYPYHYPILRANCRNSGDRFISHGLNGGQKTKLLKVHNALRNMVASGNVRGQPPAQNMREMVWDEKLAQIAQRWADRCVFEHDPHRVYPGRGDSFGQNLYMSSQRVMTDDHNMTEAYGKVEDGAYSWYYEVRGYKYQVVTAGNFARAGHYTQFLVVPT